MPIEEADAGATSELGASSRLLREAAVEYVVLTAAIIREGFDMNVRARPGRLNALAFLSVSLCKSVLYGVFVWARRALNS
jgi:hypothetical protein